MFMQYHMDKSLWLSIPNVESLNAKQFLEAVGNKFVKFDKAEKAQYLSLLEKTKYDGVTSICEHVMKLVHSLIS